MSENKIRKELKENFKENGVEVTEEQLENIVAKQLKEVVKAGVQTINYQLNTLQTSNG